ncbi:Antitoxin VapB1 [Agrobacterium sp. DSM 25558]|uniref:antitoxin n=1 Tax=Agrobacterium sp. DSM 25558 TaxID=1907665 RepID=UPI00097259FA|nr:AbrB/MazE/SpoVT family DNA-binding domain-containing protein [Agrobacterium sp. DSM 25558]SCX24400.1 Antitoxin VapB1 [Agrobacterium sp. DSM 25558]
MNVVKIAQVFNNGRSRAIRIPKEFEFEADQVEVRMTENGDLLVHPVKKKSLLALLASLEPLSDEDRMPEIEDYPPEPVDLGESE